MKQTEILIDVPDDVTVTGAKIGLVCSVCQKEWGIKLFDEWGVWIAKPFQFICRDCKRTGGKYASKTSAGNDNQ